MAQRLATEYVKTCLELTEAEMAGFIKLFADHQATLQVKVLENGSQEVVLTDDADAEVVLSFERRLGKYVCTGQCRMTNMNLVNAMRKAVAQYKGSAIVNRIYKGYTMVYHYDRGSVVKIIEMKGAEQKLIYEHKATLSQLEELFLRTDIEREIAGIHTQIDGLLDLRKSTPEAEVRLHLDDRLQRLSRRLFALEA